MNKSDSIAALAAALAKAQGQMTGALKDSSNPFFKSKYADLASVVAAIREPFSTNGLSYTQILHESQDGVAIETLLMHGSGEWLSCGILRLPVTKADAQGVGSAVTYARRYSLQAAVGLAAEDDDGNAATKAAPPARAKDIPPPPPSDEWTPEERKEGKQMAYDLGDAMTAAGVSEEEAEKKVKDYLGQIGEGTFNAYKNRLASATVRVIPPAPKDDAEIILSILDAPDMDSLSRTYKAHFKAATAANNVALMASLTTAKDQRKAQLTNA